MIISHTQRPSSESSWVHGISTIVVDEADALEHSEKTVLSLFRYFHTHRRAHPPRFVFVGATFPDQVREAVCACVYVCVQRPLYSRFLLCYLYLSKFLSYTHTHIYTYIYIHI
jgi:hypothetical protein